MKPVGVARAAPGKQGDVTAVGRRQWIPMRRSLARSLAASLIAVLSLTSSRSDAGDSHALTGVAHLPRAMDYLAEIHQ